MNYELRTIRLDHSGSIFGAEHMRQVCALRKRQNAHIKSSIAYISFMHIFTYTELITYNF